MSLPMLGALDSRVNGYGRVIDIDASIPQSDSVELESGKQIPHNA